MHTRSYPVKRHDCDYRRFTTTVQTSHNTVNKVTVAEDKTGLEVFDAALLRM